MSTNPGPSGAPKPRKPRYRVQVKNVEKLTPHMVRVTFTGDELANFGWNGPAAHIKLIFSAEDQSPPAAAGQENVRPTMRTYTPRRFDAQARELDVEFVLHGEGPASTWAEQAAVGQSLLIAGPGRCYAVDAEAPWFVLAGDESALPAISTILEALPDSAKALVFLEIVDDSERRPLTSRAQVEIAWLARGSDAAQAGRALEEALRRVELPPGAGRVYVACEANAMRRIRAYLLHERKLDRSRLVTRGYWKLGSTDHPDGDYGEDVG